MRPANIALALLMVCCVGSAVASLGEIGPVQRAVMEAQGLHSRRELWSIQQNASVPITYYGGDVMTGNVSIRMIYLGYNQDDDTPDWTNWFIRNLGNKDYYRTTKSLYKINNTTREQQFANGNIALRSAWYFPSPANLTAGTTFNASASETSLVLQYIALAIDARNNVPTSNDIYILMSKNGTIPRPSCDQWNTTDFGWASSFALRDISFKFAFVPEDYCMAFYNLSTPNYTRSAFAPAGYNAFLSPTGDGMIDSMLVTLSQVIVETVADPEGTAWHGINYNETIASVCEDYYYYPLAQATVPLNVSEITGNASATGVVNVTIQYTDPVGEWALILPLIYNPAINNATGEPWGCVYGVAANGTVIPATIGSDAAWAFNTTLSGTLPAAPAMTPTPMRRSLRERLGL